MRAKSSYLHGMEFAVRSMIPYLESAYVCANMPTPQDPTRADAYCQYATRYKTHLPSL